MSRWRLPRWLLAAPLLVAIAASWSLLGGRSLATEDLTASLQSLGAWGPLLFVLLYAAGTLLFLPGSVFALGAGALFGPVWGALLSLAGAALGATGAFVLARYVASDWVRARAGPRLERFIRGIEAEGWRFVAFVRLVPLFPFNLTNYALGLTRIPLAHYVLASLACMVPGAAAYTWLGHAGRSALEGDVSAIRWGLGAIGMLAAIVLLPRFLRRVRGEAPRWIEAVDLVDELAARRPTVIDVRGPDELAGPLGHIAEAINIPLGELPDRLTAISSLEARPVVVVCRTDKRSASAAALLGDAGFRDVRVLRGGMESWHRIGQDVVRGTPGPITPRTGEPE